MRLLNRLDFKIKDIYEYFKHDNVSYIIDIANSLFSLGIDDICLKSLGFNMSSNYVSKYPNYFKNLQENTSRLEILLELLK